MSISESRWRRSSTDREPGHLDAVSGQAHLGGTRSSRDCSFLSRRSGRLGRARGLGHAFHPGRQVAEEQRRQIGDDDADDDDERLLPGAGLGCEKSGEDDCGERKPDNGQAMSCQTRSRLSVAARQAR